jgi:hypothetical protein
LKGMYRVLTATVFLVPALLLSSCDDQNSTPVSPSDDPTVSDIEAPSFTSVGFGSKWHDPHIKGPKVRIFTNNFLGAGCEAKAKRFGSQDGAELEVTFTLPGFRSTEFTSKEDRCDAGVYPVDQRIRGKKLGQVKELDFSYAGGDEAGAPRMRIPIDECRVEDLTTTAVTPGCTTDGTMELYAYIDVRTCNDGDANVGVVNGEDSPACEVEYDDVSYDNWNDFASTHSDWRIARKVRDVSPFPAPPVLVDALTSVVLSPFFQLDDGTSNELSPHYLIWMVDVR